MWKSVGYAVAASYAIVGIGTFLLLLLYGDPEYPLTGLPLGVVFCIFAFVCWRAVGRGKEICVALSPVILAALVALGVIL